MDPDVRGVLMACGPMLTPGAALKAPAGFTSGGSSRELFAGNADVSVEVFLLSPQKDCSRGGMDLTGSSAGGLPSRKLFALLLDSRSKLLHLNHLSLSGFLFWPLYAFIWPERKVGMEIGRMKKQQSAKLLSVWSLFYLFKATIKWINKGSVH